MFVYNQQLISQLHPPLLSWYPLSPALSSHPSVVTGLSMINIAFITVSTPSHPPLTTDAINCLLRKYIILVNTGKWMANACVMRVSSVWKYYDWYWRRRIDGVDTTSFLRGEIIITLHLYFSLVSSSPHYILQSQHSLSEMKRADEAWFSLWC